MKAGGTHKYAQIRKFLAAALHNNIINLIAFGKKRPNRRYAAERNERTHKEHIRALQSISLIIFLRPKTFEEGQIKI